MIIFFKAVVLLAVVSQSSAQFTLRSWEDAYALANATVVQMTLDEKIGVVTGTGQLNSNRVPFRAACLETSTLMFSFCLTLPTRPLCW